MEKYDLVEFKSMKISKFDNIEDLKNDPMYIKVLKEELIRLNKEYKNFTQEKLSEIISCSQPSISTISNSLPKRLFEFEDTVESFIIDEANSIYDNLSRLKNK